MDEDFERERQRQLFEAEAREFNRCIATVAHTDEGKRLFKELMDLTFQVKSIFVTNAQIYYKSGQQDFGRVISEWLATAAPDVWTQVHMELMTERKTPSES